MGLGRGDRCTPGKDRAGCITAGPEDCGQDNEAQRDPEGPRRFSDLQEAPGRPRPEPLRVHVPGGLPG